MNPVQAHRRRAVWICVPFIAGLTVLEAESIVPTPPDAFGAVGPNHVMSIHNPDVVIQTKDGQDLYRATMADFWATDAPHLQFDYWYGSPVDGRVLFDPFYEEEGSPQNGVGRWIVVAVANPNHVTSSLLIAVSQTDDPTGDWHKYQVHNTGGEFITFPNVGFNSQWIAIHGLLTDFEVRLGRLYILDKADFYSGGEGWVQQTDLTNTVVTMCPAITYDDDESDLQFIEIRPGEIFPRLGRISGTVRSPVIELDVAHATVPALWAKTTADFGGGVPQLGSSAMIATSHEMLWNVVYQNGSLWFSHGVYLPLPTPNRATVQWWQIAPDGTVIQFGQLDDPTAEYSYANPSLTVNESDDVLLGFTRFSALTYPTSMYAYRSHLDPLNELRAPTVLKSGEASFNRPHGGGVNVWGTTSASVMDPNGTNMWTLQQYAAGPVDRWGTWWGQVTPPPSLDLQIDLETSTDAATQGDPIVYSIIVSNTGPVTATNATLRNTLSPQVGFVSATSSVGFCSISNQVLTCELGELAPGATASLVLEAIALWPGAATHTASVFSIETDTNLINNVALASTCIDFSALPDIWINELHYDDVGLLIDQDEGVEIAGVAGADLSGLQLVFYDGVTGVPYDSHPLEGIIDAETNGYGALWFPRLALENGAVPLVNSEGDGVALATLCGQVLQFISYEGVIAASAGVADGMMSTDIGVVESQDTPLDHSLQLIGMGFGADDLSWRAEEPASRGEINLRQYLEVPAFADLGVSGSVVPSVTTEGVTVVYSLITSNAGPEAAEQVVLDIELPTNVTFVGASVSQGNFQQASGQVHCVLSTLPFVGSQAYVTITGSVAGIGINTTEIETYGKQNDVNPGNNAITLDVCIGFGDTLPPIWINEIHYDDTNFFDVAEGIEIAGPAGTDLGVFTLLLYEGDNGNVYRTVPLSGRIDDEGTGYGAVWFPVPAIRNGQVFPPFDQGDGVALAAPCTGIVEFISYETSFPANSGQAAGEISIDIEVYEAGAATATNESLQRVGSGTVAGDFTWIGPVPHSPGQLNVGQAVVPEDDPDLDGIPSHWESLHFGGPTNAVADKDSDLDGFTNFEEYIADTIPTNAASFFQIESLLFQPQPGIKVLSSSNRLYSMESSTDLTDTQSWIDVVRDVPGTGGLLLLIDTNAPISESFYRSRVRLP